MNNEKIKKTLLKSIHEEKFSLYNYTPIEKSELIDFIFQSQSLLFPGYFEKCTKKSLPDFIDEKESNITRFLSNKTKKTNLTNIYKKLIKTRKVLISDVNSIFTGDPAAKSTKEIILSYPGFQATLIYRIAHILLKEKIALIPRLLTEIGHQITGIDIHPNAKIGHSFCIDHGSGLVIGETAVIGNVVKLYQGVTLGAFSTKTKSSKKRHPTLKNHVTVYARSTILGGDTIIGNHVTIGGNTWITKSISDNTKVYISQDALQRSKSNG